MQFKEIHYDSIITEFGFEKSLHIHIKAGKKLKDIKKIDSILDKHIKSNFYQEIAPTGEFIQQELAKLDLDKHYSPKENEKIEFSKGRSIYYKKDLPKERPEEFTKVREQYQDLMRLYESPAYIHKSFTEELNGSTWGEEAGWSYIIHYKSPFIDEILLKMTKEINEDLVNQGFVFG